MEWALGFANDGVSQQIELRGTTEQQHSIGINELSTAGIPNLVGIKQRRVAFEGDFSTWSEVCAESYLSAFGIELPIDHLNRHAVFALTSRCGVTIQVPSLVLMRAFFKPTLPVFPAMFRPANIDLLSFVDYASSPPRVVIDDAQCAKKCANLAVGVSQTQFIHWLQTSLSARRMVQSVHQHACKGQLSIDIPVGRVRIIFHGSRAGNRLYATKASLISVEIPSADSISGVNTSFAFHSSSDAGRTPLAGVCSYQVPMHPNGDFAVTQEEWNEIEPLLAGKKKRATVHSRREVLDIILHKLSSGLSWKTVPKQAAITMLDVTMAFRRWAASGRLDCVLAVLQESRSKEAEDRSGQSMCLIQE